MLSAKSWLAIAVVTVAVAIALGHIGYGGYNAQYYPGLVSGYGGNFFNYQPSIGHLGCRYWCRSYYTRQYYCCDNLGSHGFYGGAGGYNTLGGGFGGFGAFGGGFNNW